MVAQLHCVSTFTCDRNQIQGTSEGDSLQSNPPQNWVRINHNKMVGTTMQSKTYYLCPACAADFLTFMDAFKV